MTEDELTEVVRLYPRLFHMAERGAWPSIRERGLLSTTALLDLYGIDGDERHRIESVRRSACIPIPIRGDDLPNAVVRDQLPMDDDSLRRCLPSRISPKDWYKLLNSKIFFWLTTDRLHRLTCGKEYRYKSHDVLIINTARFVEAYRNRIWLSPMNSGNTRPMPHPRNENTFKRIDEYPYSQRRKRKLNDRVVEVAVDYSVPELADYVERVVVMRSKIVEEEIFVRA